MRYFIIVMGCCLRATSLYYRQLVMLVFTASIFCRNYLFSLFYFMCRRRELLIFLSVLLS